MIRWVYLGRFSVATAIFLAAQLVWTSAPAADTRIVALIFAVTTVFTVCSAAYTEVYRAPLTRTFLYIQTVFDLLLVTAVVHVTGGGASQFALFYILVIASAALLLPVGGGLLVALLGIVCYFAELLWLSDAAPDLAMWLQLLVFALVALACGYISARLQEAGEGTAAELIFVRLQAEDILRNIRSGIVTIDAQGVLLYANPAASALLGLPLADLVGSPVLPRVAGVSAAIARALERAVTDRVRTTRAEDVIHFGGHTFPIGVTTTFSEGDGPGAGDGRTATAIFQDISGQKRLESLHLRAGRLEAIAELSASLAHEIKNPLASIRSAVEQLTDMLPAPPPPGATDFAAGAAAAAVAGRRRSGARATRVARGERLPASDPAPVGHPASHNGNGHGGVRAAAAAPVVDEDARTLGALIVRETDRLSRLLSEFLDFARVRVARMAPIDIGAVARGAASLASAHPDTREGVRVHCVVPEDPAIIHGDDDLLHRAVFNLVLNAIQASPAGGQVRIEVAPLRPTQLPSGVTDLAFDAGAVAVRVIDEGPGIAPDVRDRLFEPFITTKPGGSGLGLSIVHRAIEAHRGIVLVDSGGAAHGTRVTVLLPIAHPGDATVADGPGDGSL